MCYFRYVRAREDTFKRPADYEQLIQLSADRFVVPEILFRPSVINESRMGISEAAISTIRRFPQEQQHYLFRNVVLAGGNCLFEGFKQRLTQELEVALPEFGEVNVSTLNDPQLNPWFGGKCLAENADYFDNLKVTKAEYEEHGESICEKRFIRSRPRKTV